MSACSSVPLHEPAGQPNGVDDVLVAGAATEVAVQRLSNLRLVGTPIALEQVDRRHDHSRRAIPALQAVLLDESLLDRMKRSIARQSLDGGEGGAVELDGKEGARLCRSSIDEDHTGAALAGVTPDMRAGQLQVVAEEVAQQQARLHVSLHPAAIDVQDNPDLIPQDDSAPGRATSSLPAQRHRLSKLSGRS